MITNFSPNSSRRDVLTAMKYLFWPLSWRKWQDGHKIKKLENALGEYLGVKGKVVSYDSGRTALFKALEAYGIGEGDEVILQAFTCVVVSNAIRQSGATQIYVDIEANTYNMDPRLIEEQITNKTKAIIVQHTFGFAAKLTEILDIARKHKLIVIEDCAHSLGSKYKGKMLGTFGDAAIFSFGVDKVISSVRGGALVLQDNMAMKKLQSDRVHHLPKKVILKHLLHPIIFAIGKSLYGVGSIGKVILYLAKRLNITARVIEPEEKHGDVAEWMPAKFPNALADIALNQLKELEEMNNHRMEMAFIYAEKLPKEFKRAELVKDSEVVYLRYPLQSNDRDKIMAKAKRTGVFLGDWYDTIVAPKDIDPDVTGYKGNCPVAEKVCDQVFNLPTHRGITAKHAKKIIDLIERK